MANNNPFGKHNKEGYFIVTQGSWTWKVHKFYQSPAKSLENPYARAFCSVSSPLTFGSADMGDCYIKDIPGLREELRNWIIKQSQLEIKE